MYLLAYLLILYEFRSEVNAYKYYHYQSMTNNDDIHSIIILY